MFIEVMYSTKNSAGKFNQRRVPISDAGLLNTTQALFVILSSGTTPDRSRRVIEGRHYERVAEKWGDDKTVFVRRVVDGKDSVMLEDYGKTFQWHEVANPKREWLPKMELPYAFRGDEIVFTGVMLSQEEWDKALIQFQAEMH